MFTVTAAEESVRLLQSALSTRSLNVMFTHCEIVIKDDKPGWTEEHSTNYHFLIKEEYNLTCTRMTYTSESSVCKSNPNPNQNH